MSSGALMKLVGFAVLSVLVASVVGCAARGPAPLAPSPTPAPEAPEAIEEPTTGSSSLERPAVAVADTEAPAAQPEPAEPPTPEAIPLACAGEAGMKDGKACVMPGEFVKKLCGASYPDVTLALFSKGTPWTRAWLAGDVEAWSASGGFTSRANLAFDEEVLVLARHAAPSVGGIQMTGAGASFDVLRWDGSCVSVQEGELTTRRPPAPKQATVRWSRFEEATRRALLASQKVKATREAFDKACGGEKAACERAEKDLAGAIATSLRTGGPTLPTPTRRP